MLDSLEHRRRAVRMSASDGRGTCPVRTATDEKRGKRDADIFPSERAHSPYPGNRPNDTLHRETTGREPVMNNRGRSLELQGVHTRLESPQSDFVRVLERRLGASARVLPDGRNGLEWASRGLEGGLDCTSDCNWTCDTVAEILIIGSRQAIVIRTRTGIGHLVFV